MFSKVANMWCLVLFCVAFLCALWVFGYGLAGKIVHNKAFLMNAVSEKADKLIY